MSLRRRGLTSVEQLLVERVDHGEWLDLAAKDEAVDEAAMRSWGEARTISADVIRDILRGRLVADPDPHGLRLRGARITGRLDLANLTTNVSLQLRDCLLEEGVFAQGARMAFVGLTGCQLEHPTERPLAADGLSCSVLALSEARVTGHTNAGGVSLTGAQIGGSFDCDGAELHSDSGPALLAFGLEVGQSMFLSRGFTATGAGDDGAVNLAGAHIGGSLDCDGATLRNDSGPALNANNLEAGQSVFLHRGFTATGNGNKGAVRLVGAHIGGSLDCDGATLRNDTSPALVADGLQVGQDVFLREGFTASGAGQYGAVRLTSAHIGGSLLCDGAALRNDSGPALVAYGLQVGRGVFLRNGFTATGTGERGAVRLVSAHISGSLDCTTAELRNDSGPALFADVLEVGQDVECDGLTADGGVVLGGHIGRLVSFEGAALNNRGGFALLSDGLRVDGTMFCRNGFTAQGEVRLPGARIGGRLCFDGAKLSNPGGRALVASRLTVGQDMFCRTRGSPEHERPFAAEGTVILDGAHIGGHLDCTGAQLRNDSGSALHADSLQVDQTVYLRNGFTAIGSGSGGALYLVRAHIGGHLDCTGASLRNDSGPALDAYSLQVGQGMHLFGAFTASSSFCTINLTGAHIGARLLCDGATLRNDSGPTLVAYGGLEVGQGVFLRRGFTATGAGKSGAIHLTGTHIGDHLDCTGAALRNDSGPALAARGGLRVGQDMSLTDGFTAIGGGTDVAVDLTGAQVGGRLAVDPACLDHAIDPHRRLAVDGLTYAGVPQQISAPDWLDLLRNGTPSYAAQPYQQLAAGYRALGNERQAREILMAQRDDELARADTRWPERLWGKITKVTLGYGYQPWRALLFLAGVVIVSCLLAVMLGAHGALAQTSETATPGRSCTVVQQVSVGLDLNLPVGTSVARVDCGLTKDSASVTAVWLTAVSWVLRLLAWVFAALFIAGFTSAVRKT